MWLGPLCFVAQKKKKNTKNGKKNSLCFISIKYSIIIPQMETIVNIINYKLVILED